MDYVCRNAVFQGLSPRKRLALKNQIPELRNIPCPEYFRDVRISSSHNEMNIDWNIDRGLEGMSYSTRYTLAPPNANALHCIEGERMRLAQRFRPYPDGTGCCPKLGIYEEYALCSKKILEMFLFNKVNRKGNVINRLEIQGKRAFQVLFSMKPVATFNELEFYHYHPGPGLFPNLSQFTTLKYLLYLYPKKTSSSVIDAINSINLEYVYLYMHGYNESLMTLTTPKIKITDLDGSVDFFWRFAKKLREGNFEEGSIYSIYISSYPEDDFLRRVSFEFPDAQPVPEKSQVMTVPISETNALEINNRGYLTATVYTIPVE